MRSLDPAVQTQLNNIQKKTGKSFEELSSFIKNCGLSKHGEIREFLKEKLGLGHDDANTLVHIALESDGTSSAQGKSLEELLDEIYTGPKAAFRSLHEKLMDEIHKLGESEAVPKKGYFSLRRKKQFAMLGPKTNTRFELGLNAKALEKSPRLVEQPQGSMCNYIVKMSGPEEIDSELLKWIKAAYDGAG